MVHEHDPHGSTIADGSCYDPGIGFVNGQLCFVYSDGRVELTVPNMAMTSSMVITAFNAVKRIRGL